MQILRKWCNFKLEKSTINQISPPFVISLWPLINLTILLSEHPSPPLINHKQIPQTSITCNVITEIPIWTTHNIITTHELPLSKEEQRILSLKMQQDFEKPFSVTFKLFLFSKKFQPYVHSGHLCHATMLRKIFAWHSAA